MSPSRGHAPTGGPAFVAGGVVMAAGVYLVATDRTGTEVRDADYPAVED